MVLNEESSLFKEDIFYNEGGRTLAQVAKGGGYPIHGTIQGQVGQGCEQSDPAEYVPAYCREGGL